MKYNTLLTQINFTQRHFKHKTEQIYLKMSFRLEKHTETFISPVSILKNIASKAIRYMLCHFHNRHVVKATQYTGVPNAEIFLSNLRKRSVKNISYKILIKRVLNN